MEIGDDVITASDFIICFFFGGGQCSWFQLSFGNQCIYYITADWSLKHRRHCFHCTLHCSIL